MSAPFVKTGVIGHPIAHSKSPLIHNYWIEQHGLAGAYTSIDIAPEHLNEGVLRLIDKGYSGFNVTVPHKVAIMDLCEELSPIAQEIGAVNTVTIDGGRLIGTNTDGFGFTQNIKESAPEFEFGIGKAVVFGAGGAANAIIHALLAEGVPEIIISNRSRDKADLLCSMRPEIIRAVDWDQRNCALDAAHLIVNTTALGMVGKPALEVDLSHAPQDALVTDIVYAPLMTDLLLSAQGRGMKVVTGIGMLLHQARPGFELWNGVLPDVTTDLEALVLK